MQLNKEQQVFFDLVRAGLWEQEVRLEQYGKIDYQEVLRLAEEQTVVGLVSAGLEHVADTKVPKEDALAFAGETMQLEQRNQAMNQFIEIIVDKMREKGIYTLLVKGQGIAQSYERPLWRACGDVDFLLSENNFEKAFDFLSAQASNIDEEDRYHRHIAMTIDSWAVELHGNLRSGLWKRVDRELDELLRSIFYGGNVRLWMNGNTQVFLPRADEDIVYVFTHILQHFYKEGIGLRQICDWCRLLWEYNKKIDLKLLGKRLQKMGIRSEWKTFASFAVNYLGMPKDSMPFYSDELKWNKKAAKVLNYIIGTGNFGHNRDYSYYRKYPYLIYKTISMWRHIQDAFTFLSIFPIDALKVTERRLRVGLVLAVKGKNHE